MCSSVVVSDTFSGYAPDRWQMKKWQFEPQSSHKSSNMNQSLFEKLFHCCKLQTHDFWMSLMFAVVLSAFCCRSSSRNTRTRTQMQPQRQNWHRTMVQKLMDSQAGSVQNQVMQSRQAKNKKSPRLQIKSKQHCKTFQHYKKKYETFLQFHYFTATGQEMEIFHVFCWASWNWTWMSLQSLQLQQTTKKEHAASSPKSKRQDGFKKPICSKKPTTLGNKIWGRA